MNPKNNMYTVSQRGPMCDHHGTKLHFTVTLFIFGMQEEIECLFPTPEYHQVFDAQRNRQMALEVWDLIKCNRLEHIIGELFVNAWTWEEWPFVSRGVPPMKEVLDNLSPRKTSGVYDITRRAA